MSDLLQPADEAELAATVADAAAKRTPLAVEGGGTLRGLGRPMQTAATLSTARLTGVTLYEPAEMVLSARAGTPVEEIAKLLAGKGQRLLRCDGRRRRRRNWFAGGDRASSRTSLPQCSRTQCADLVSDPIGADRGPPSAAAIDLGLDHPMRRPNPSILRVKRMLILLGFF